MTIDPASGEDQTAAAAQQDTAPPPELLVRYDEPVESAQGPAPAQTTQFVYAIGRIEARFPSLGVEKEFAQATGRADSAGLTDRETAQAMLSDPANRYLARQLCWVLTIEGIDTYLLIPRDATDLDLLIDSIRPAPSPLDVDVVIGTLGPLAGPDVCNGLVAPMVAFDQIYSFDTEGFLAAMPRPEAVAAKEFKNASEEVFKQIGQGADNSGATDEHRALNYLTVRYPRIYERAAEVRGILNMVDKQRDSVKMTVTNTSTAWLPTSARDRGLSGHTTLRRLMQQTIQTGGGARRVVIRAMVSGGAVCEIGPAGPAYGDELACRRRLARQIVPTGRRPAQWRLLVSRPHPAKSVRRSKTIRQRLATTRR